MMRRAQKGFEVFAKFFAFPGGHGTVVYTKHWVGHYLVGINTQDTAISLAGRTSAVRVIVVKQLRRRLRKQDAIELEAVVELPRLRVRFVYHFHPTFAFTFVKSNVHTVRQPHEFRFILRVYNKPIDEYGQAELAELVCGLLEVKTVGGQQVFYPQNLALYVHPVVAFLKQKVHFLFQGALFVFFRKRDQHQATGAFGLGADEVDHVAYLVFAHLLATDGRVKTADAGIQQPQKIIYLRHGAHCGTRIAGGNTLLNGDGRANAADEIHIGLFHAPQKLPGVTRQALHVPALPFGV